MDILEHILQTWPKKAQADLAINVGNLGLSLNVLKQARKKSACLVRSPFEGV